MQLGHHRQSFLARGVVPLVVAMFAVGALAGCSGSSSSGTPSSSAAPTTAQASSSPAQVSVKSPPSPVCPLTGQPPTKTQSVTRPALAVKIDNISAALPQTGVNNADVVVEELVEGGLTRLMAIFQCTSSAVVGPIRSARISDADILALLHGSVLGFSGANPSDLPPIIAHGDAVLISQDSDPQYFYLNTSRAAPHDVYSSTQKLVQAGVARRHKLTAPKPLFSYGTIDPSAKPAHSVSLSWSFGTSAVWTWSKHGWLRVQDGSTDRLASGAQISATNVVVMSVDIASTGLHDVLGNPSPRDVTTGSNPLWVMRNGKIIKGTWHRPSVNSPLRLLDKSGHIINLAPGRTWIELLPKPAKPTVH